MDFQSLGGEIAKIKERRKMRGITLNESERLMEHQTDATQSKDKSDTWLLESVRIIGESAELLGATVKASRTAAMATVEIPGS